MSETSQGAAHISELMCAFHHIEENRAGRPTFTKLRQQGREHQIETVGQSLRSMMPFIAAGKERVEDASGG